MDSIGIWWIAIIAVLAIVLSAAGGLKGKQVENAFDNLFWLSIAIVLIVGLLWAGISALVGA